MTPTKALEQLVRDHTVQAGIALAVALGVWHWKCQFGRVDDQLWRVEDIIKVLRTQGRILISDHDGILRCEGEATTPAIMTGVSSLKWVTPAAYIASVVILGANAVNVHRQIREAE